MKIEPQDIQLLLKNKDNCLQLVRRSEKATYDPPSIYYKTIAKEYGIGAHQVIIWLASKLTDTKKRARNANLDFNLKLSDLVTVYLNQQGLCALTGVFMQCESGSLWNKGPKNISIDRQYNEVGYIKDNVRLVCHWANNAKSTYSDDEFWQFVSESYTNRQKLILPMTDNTSI